MSKTDPDARARRVSTVVRPIAWVLAVLGLFSGPILFWISESLGNAPSRVLPFIGLYLLFSIGFGILLYAVVAHRNGLGVTAFIVAYFGGLFLVLTTSVNSKSTIAAGVRDAIVIYAIALVLFVIYIVRAAAAHQTLTGGLTTTATVTGAGIDVMVNYVQNWKLTLKFTDGNGTDRWFHIFRTGGSYSIGDKFTIKYNPKNPGSKRGIVVLDG
jgi:hypothetical protein